MNKPNKPKLINVTYRFSNINCIRVTLRLSLNYYSRFWPRYASVRCAPFSFLGSLPRQTRCWTAPPIAALLLHMQAPWDVYLCDLISVRQSQTERVNKASFILISNHQYEVESVPLLEGPRAFASYCNSLFPTCG